METALLLVKKILHKIDYILYSILFWGLTPKMIDVITSRSYKVKDETARAGTWRDFKKDVQEKRVVLLGLDGVTPDFIEKYRDRFQIACIYAFTESHKIKEFRGLPVKNAAQFRPDIYGGDNIYLITSSFFIGEYAGVLRRSGITSYYSYVVMENKKFHYWLRRPAVRFRYVFLYRFLHPDGLFTNYIWFPIKAVLRKLHIPGFYDESCREIKRYKNIHEGERCFIVATGPSLRIEDVELLKNEVTFSVNGIFRMFSQTDWRPTYYCLCDPYVYLDYIKKGYIMDLDHFAVKEAFLPTYLEKTLRKNRHTEKTKLIPFCYLSHMLSAKDTRLYYSEDPVWGFYNTRTVACFCANLAQYMGFREIYFLGTDCDYITNGQHFSDEKSPNLTSLIQLQKGQNSLIKAFAFLKEEMDKRGIQVYNATRGGALEVFPRVRLEDVLGVPPLAAAEDSAGPAEIEDSGEKALTAVGPQTEEASAGSGAVDVSIIVPTYNHERYIRQALDSILKQSTDYTYEVLVGDDASPDDTAEILKEYAQEHPGVFRLFLNRENVGPTRNAWNLFSHARGRYIASLEGDDYWCTNDKLQRQINFLEKNPEYIGCTHSCRWVDINGKIISSIAVNNGLKRTGDYTVDDLKDGMWWLPGQAMALVYRNIYLDPKNEWIKELILLDRMQCDRSVAMALASMGPIKCMPEVMSHYRHVPHSTTSYSSLYNKDVHRKQEVIRYLQSLESYTDTLFGEHITFEKRRERIFTDAVMGCWPDISEEDYLALNEIIVESGNESYYRQLLADTQDNAKKKQERAVIEQIKQSIKATTLYVPKAIKKPLVWLRNKLFSPVFLTSGTIEAQTKQIRSELREARVQIQSLEKNLAACQDTLDFFITTTANGAQNTLKEKKDGPDTTNTD